MADITEQFRLDGKAALITGAGKGIGRGIALAYADAGADVALVARTKDDLEAVAEQVRAFGCKAVPIPADVTDIDGLKDVVDQAARSLGGLDILVNNAGGVEQLGVYTDMTVAIIEGALRFNVSVPFELGRLALPHMLERGGGAIVNIGSMAGAYNERGFLAYSLAKSALAKLTQLAAVELAPRVRVNADPARGRRDRRGQGRHGGDARGAGRHARQDADATQRHTGRHRFCRHVLGVTGVVVDHREAAGGGRGGTLGAVTQRLA